MPPKKRAATTTAKASAVVVTPVVAPKRAKRGAKNKKEEEEEEEPEEIVVKKEEDDPVTKDNIITKLKEADKKSNKVKVYLPDKLAPLASSVSVCKYFLDTCRKTPANMPRNHLSPCLD